MCAVLIHRGERYRLYPTPEQSVTLAAWEHSLRFLWNVAQPDPSKKFPPRNLWRLARDLGGSQNSAS